MSYYKPDYDGPEKFVAAQEKADEILRLKNQAAPRWLDGENLETYERRLASRIQPYSPNAKDINLNHATGSAFEVLRNQIYQDTIKETAHPTQFTNKDELREITKYDQSGRPYTQFYGHPSAWMSMFSSGKRRLIGIRTETQKGYVDAALAIGRRIREQPRFVIVPDGGQCLSACVFILLSARFEKDSLSFSKAFAFSDATIAVHWPELSTQGSAEMRHAAEAPETVFKLFGEYWTKLNAYSLEVTGSDWLSLALLRSLSLKPGEMYVVNSAIERKLAGINSIIVPSTYDRISEDSVTLRNLCVLNAISADSKRVSDIESYQFEKSNLFYLFYPADNKLCFAQRNSRDIRIFSFDYGSAGGDANGIGPSPGSLTRVKSAFWDELKKVGLGREVIETKYGIGHAIESLTSGDIGSSLDLLAKLNEKYACVQCGENAGAIVFANDPARCWMSERQDEHYISLLRKKGFSCDNVLNAYILMAVMFNHKDLHYDENADRYETIPLFLQPTSVSISKGCDNEYGICSEDVGSVNGGVFSVARAPRDKQ